MAGDPPPARKGLLTVHLRHTDTYAEGRTWVELGTTPNANISIPCMSASGRKRAVHGSHEETTVPGEGNESDLPVTILDGCVECDHS